LFINQQNLKIKSFLGTSKTQSDSNWAAMSHWLPLHQISDEVRAFLLTPSRHVENAGTKELIDILIMKPERLLAVQEEPTRLNILTDKVLPLIFPLDIMNYYVIHMYYRKTRD
jgi:hypothetical protein